jgi:hypothetical protein
MHELYIIIKKCNVHTSSPTEYVPLQPTPTTTCFTKEIHTNIDNKLGVAHTHAHAHARSTYTCTRTHTHTHAHALLFGPKSYGGIGCNDLRINQGLDATQNLVGQ